MREEGKFTIRIELVAEFDESYEGDNDGFVWLERWRSSTKLRVLRSVFEALRADPAFDAVPVSRGASPDEEAEIQVRFRPGVSEGS